MNQNNTIDLLSEDAHIYSINTAAIWENERSIVFSENCDETFAIKLLSNLREIIELKGECNFNSESYDRGDDSFKDYYSGEMNLFLKSHLDFKEIYRIEFFFDAKGNCFSYHTTVLITKRDSNFDYWFALYLRQFDDKIIEIDNFLHFQLLTNFENHCSEFVIFLKHCLRQFSDLFSSKIVLTAQEWLENNALNKSQPRRNNKRVKSSYTPNKSFKLDGVDNFQDYFEKKALPLTEIIHELRNEFIHETTKIQQLKDILSGIVIHPKNRINWIGSFKELNMFVSILNYDLNKIEPIKNGIWEVACLCFTKMEKKFRSVNFRMPMVKKPKDQNFCPSFKNYKVS